MHVRLSKVAQALWLACLILQAGSLRYLETGEGAPTIPDLVASEAITPEHVSEAIQYRTFDRTLWV